MQELTPRVPLSFCIGRSVTEIRLVRTCRSLCGDVRNLGIKAIPYTPSVTGRDREPDAVRFRHCLEPLAFEPDVRAFAWPLSQRVNRASVDRQCLVSGGCLPEAGSYELSDRPPDCAGAPTLKHTLRRARLRADHPAAGIHSHPPNYTPIGRPVHGDDQEQNGHPDQALPERPTGQLRGLPPRD